MTPLWLLTRDGDRDAFSVARRHYSAWKNKRPKQRQFVGPGEAVVLITEERNAVYVWRKQRYAKHSQTGVECSIFRNEGHHLSSLLIRQACRVAACCWPGERCFTFVDPAKVKPKANPGYCFIAAGWRLVRWPDGKPLTTSRGLLVFEWDHSWEESLS
jgi:hypothetical protein